MNGSSEQRLALHFITPKKPSRQAVLFVHGSTYPTRLSTGFEFSADDSWMAHVAGQGILACGLDFLGYGGSSQIPVQFGPAGELTPPSAVSSKVEQIAVAIDAIRQRWNVTTLHLVAHSYGTMPASAFAAAYPTALCSLTLFGPIVPLPGYLPEAILGHWFLQSSAQRFDRLHTEGMSPFGKLLLEPEVEARWSTELAASAPCIGGDTFGELRILNGPNHDINGMKAGAYPYSPEDVQAPVFVVYGNYDDVVDDESGKAHLARFASSPVKWQLRIDEGTHSMQLEHSRHSLYAAVDGFVAASEQMHEAKQVNLPECVPEVIGIRSMV
jgi:pimeloyl-ACP methyl ester carboxylesterase